MRYTTRVVHRPLSILLLVLLAFPAGALADIFRYVGRDGVEHYTNVQPTSGRWQRVYRGKPTGTGGAWRRKQRGRRAPDPGRLTRYDGYIREAARLYYLPEPFLRAVMRVESNFYADAVSGDGAMGLMQLMPGTADSMGVVDPFDPRQNVLGGARFLRVLANKLQGDLVLTVAAYNAGPGAVRRHGGVPPYAETQRYVRKVLRYYDEFRRSETASR